ncbi:MAG: hypothetical protein AAF664_04965 [Planctomycetota bacterium]
MLQRHLSAHTIFAIAICALVAVAASALAEAQECSDCGTSDSSYVGDLGGEVIEGDGGFIGDMSPSDAGCIGRGYGQPDLFYNYFTQGNCNTANAQLYVSPLPVPPFVGHTFYTYQPFHPHHYLYAHTDRYHRYYDNGRGMNRTKVSYGTRPIFTAVQNVYWNKLRIPR